MGQVYCLSMRVVLISDTHNQLSHVSVPAGDILIHAGDATMKGLVSEAVEFAQQLNRLPHPHKIFVPGNHDWPFEKDLVRCRGLLGPGVSILVDEYVEVAGLKIYGSPWTPRHADYAFNLDRGEPIAQKWRQIPDGLDILVTHGPPHEILDLTMIDENMGCEALRSELKRIKPKVHVFGHLHNSYGATQLDGIHFINASICDEDYGARNEPFVLDFRDGRVFLQNL